MNASIETRWETGSAKTFRDENGGLWVIAHDAGDGTLAIQNVCSDEETTMGTTPCAVATWNDLGIEITEARSHGENSTDGDEYTGSNGEEFRATSSGWIEQ